MWNECQHLIMVSFKKSYFTWFLINLLWGNINEQYWSKWRFLLPISKHFPLEMQSRHLKSLSYSLNRHGFQGAVGKSGVLIGWDNYQYQFNGRHHTRSAHCIYNLRHQRCHICAKAICNLHCHMNLAKNWAELEIPRFYRLGKILETFGKFHKLHQRRFGGKYPA